jgi:hypothetical protein
MKKEIKKYYNPFKMWGSWIGAISILCYSAIRIIIHPFKYSPIIYTGNVVCDFGILLVGGFLIGWGVHYLIRKKPIILIGIVVFFLLIPFVTEKILGKKADSFSILIPWTSRCKDKPFQRCTLSGSNILFKELNNNKEKILFKRELTNNNCYEFDIVNKIIQSQDDCDISDRHDLEDNLQKKEWDKKYLGECSPNERYCIKHRVKGKFRKSHGIGFIPGLEQAWGLEIFEIEDKVKDKIVYREVRIKIGGHRKLGVGNTYWGDNDSFLMFMRSSNDLYYLPLEEHVIEKKKKEIVNTDIISEAQVKNIYHVKNNKFICDEADDKKDLFTKETAILIATKYSQDDSCVNKSGRFSENVYSCSGENCFLNEGYCEKNSSYSRDIFVCPNGCRDGACISE